MTSNEPAAFWDELILLGTITRTQGHHGAVRMRPEFEPLDRFEGLKSDELFLRMTTAPPETGSAVADRERRGTSPNDAIVAAAARVAQPRKSDRLPPDARVVHVSEYFFHQRYVVLSFQEVPDMNAAELLRGAEVYVRPEDLWALEENEFYTYQVEGFAVVDAETGSALGEVRGIEAGSAHDYIKVRSSATERDFLIPLVKQMLRGIDWDGKRVLVSIPEGLDEL